MRSAASPSMRSRSASGCRGDRGGRTGPAGPGRDGASESRGRERREERARRGGRPDRRQRSPALDHRAAPGPGAQFRGHRQRRAPFPQRRQLRPDPPGPGRGHLRTSWPATSTLARQAGLDLLRVHAHVDPARVLPRPPTGRGMLIWQDLPLQWGYGQVRRQAVSQARQAVSLLGHHPSVALWCGHNEPVAVDGAAPAGTPRPGPPPAWSPARCCPAGTRPASTARSAGPWSGPTGPGPVVAHSGVLPHPAWGTDSHLYFGWYHGEERDLPALLARVPVVARFVSEFGAQAVPDTAEFMHPERWPDLDWEHLEAHHGLQRAIFERRVPPGRSLTFADWRAATQAVPGHPAAPPHRDPAAAQIPPDRRVLRVHAGRRPARRELVDPRPPAAAQGRLRRGGRGLRPGDHHRRPARRASYRPGSRLALDVHVVSDLRAPLAGVVAGAVLRWPGGEKAWRYKGDVPADSCVRVGRVDARCPPRSNPGPSPSDLELLPAGTGAGPAISYAQPGGMRPRRWPAFFRRNGSPRWPEPRARPGRRSSGRSSRRSGARAGGAQRPGRRGPLPGGRDRSVPPTSRPPGGAGGRRTARPPGRLRT